MPPTPHADNRFRAALSNRTTDVPPIWLMRQAGRYLPEYRQVRESVSTFLELCENPVLAAEVTLQPIERFDFDAAIIFSDILMVPHALGQKVEFVQGEGPKLDPADSAAKIAALDPGAAEAKFAAVYDALGRVRQRLSPAKSLIGFCGAPWTVATYMVGGKGSKDQAETRTFAYAERETFQSLIDLLVESSADYLIGQIEAGADALQIFDSWAGSLPEDEFARWCTAPTKALVAKVKARFPDIPIIGFPRGAGMLAEGYLAETGVDALGCDTSMPLRQMAALQRRKPVQGNLDPVLLMTGGKALDDRVHEILDALSGRPFVFNLGHGILPQTPPENVARLVSLVRNR